jgi:hypothetical protein
MAIGTIAAGDADYSFPDNHCSSACNCCSSAVGLTVAHRVGHHGRCRRCQRIRHPPAGEKGITVDRSSNQLGAADPSRPARLATGIIGGIAVGACPAETAPVPANGIAATPGLIESAAPAHSPVTS